MPKPSLGIERVNVGVDARVWQVYVKVAADMGVPTSQLIRDAMTEYLKVKLRERLAANRAFNAALDKAIALGA